MGTSRDVPALDWQILFRELGGATLGLGGAWIDFAFWSPTARFYGWARLGGVSAGFSGGALYGSDDSSMWLVLSPDAAFSMNELHGSAGRAELDFGFRGKIDGVLKSWNHFGWLFSGSEFTIRSDGTRRAAGHVWIRGTWELKEVWGFQD
jgi:hypothetical protein